MLKDIARKAAARIKKIKTELEEEELVQEKKDNEIRIHLPDKLKKASEMVAEIKPA